jgi:hypothetical protein
MFAVILSERFAVGGLFSLQGEGAHVLNFCGGVEKHIILS